MSRLGKIFAATTTALLVAPCCFAEDSLNTKCIAKMTKAGAFDLTNEKMIELNDGEVVVIFKDRDSLSVTRGFGRQQSPHFPFVILKGASCTVGGYGPGPSSTLASRALSLRNRLKKSQAKTIDFDDAVSTCKKAPYFAADLNRSFDADFNDDGQADPHLEPAVK